jgi:arginyl-tRNA synthetase
VITAELRRAILAAAGAPDADPLLRPGPVPGSYASSLPFRLARLDPRALAAEPWIAEAQVTGAGYLTVTVTREALAGLATRIPLAGPACAASDALRGRSVAAPAESDLGAAPDWPRARAALAAQLTARLAAAAGAKNFFYPERTGVPPPGTHAPIPGGRATARSGQRNAEALAAAGDRVGAQPPAAGVVARAVEYAGLDAVRFALARTPPGGPPPDAAAIARHVLGNPAYAVRYAHAAAVAVLRWAGALGISPGGPEGFRPRLLAEPAELALLDALSWLPERVAVAARRGRPDEFARYTEGLAARTIDVMSTTGFRKVSDISGERLWLADAARTGLAASLGLLGVGAPGRL